MSSFFDMPLALLHLQQVEQLTVTYQLGGKRARAETDCSEAPGQVLGGGARAGFHFHEAVVCFLDLGIRNQLSVTSCSGALLACLCAASSLAGVGVKAPLVD